MTPREQQHLTAALALCFALFACLIPALGGLRWQTVAATAVSLYPLWHLAAFVGRKCREAEDRGFRSQDW